MSRPTLTDREAKLLAALQIMKLWVSHQLEPIVSGTGEPYTALQRDMAFASRAIEEATGGCES
jgi:hypothetical protein